MKRSILILFLVVCAITSKAQNTASDVQALAMLKNFYTTYMTEVAIGKPPASEKKIDAIQKKYCTPALISKIKRLQQSGDLDWDPFIKAQDSNIESVKTLVVKKGATSNSYVVSYTDIYSHSTISINVILTKLNGSFKIASVDALSDLRSF